MREVTERPEAIATGAARVVGTDPTKILSNVNELINEQGVYQQMAAAVNPYGDGRAASRIAAALLQLETTTEQGSFSSELRFSR